MARNLEEVADILFVILNDNIKYFEIPYACFSKTTLSLITDRNDLTPKQIGFLKHRLKEFNSVLVIKESTAILMTDKHYRKSVKRAQR